MKIFNCDPIARRKKSAGSFGDLYENAFLRTAGGSIAGVLVGRPGFIRTASVELVTPEGKTTAEDGRYNLKDGRLLDVMNGKIVKVFASTQSPSPANATKPRRVVSSKPIQNKPGAQRILKMIQAAQSGSIKLIQQALR